MYSRVLRSLLIVSKKYSLPQINQVTNKYNLQGKINFIRTCYTSAAPNSQEPDKRMIEEEFYNLGDEWNCKDKNEKAQERLDRMLKDPAILRHYKIIELEIEVMRQSGDDIPTEIKTREWVELLLMPSRAKRKRYLNFLFGIEHKEKNKKAKRLARAEEVAQLKEAGLLYPSDLPVWLQYKLGGNSLYTRVRESTMNAACNWRLHSAAMWGPKVVLDCGFEEKMNRQEIRNCAKQLQLAFAVNRESSYPLDLHFCNLNMSGYLFEELYSYIPTMLEPEFPVNLTDGSYLDKFPKEKLIYLTPDCNQVMSEYDTEAVYVVGALVDKLSGVPTTLAKAKRESLRMAKLPIDKYLSFGSGSNKSLTINQVIAILNDFYVTGDWHHALRHVPRRKLLESRQAQVQKKLSFYLPDNESKTKKSRFDHKNSTIKDFSFESRKKFRSN